MTQDIGAPGAPAPESPEERRANRRAAAAAAAAAQRPPPAPPRTSLQVTRSVWKALLLRESLTRLFSSRGAWFWLLAEPVVHIAYMMAFFTFVKVRHIGGLETAAWVMIGLLSFLGFRRTASQCMNAVHSNRALFTYRQVKPIDTVLTRGILEGSLLVVVSGILIAASSLAGVQAVPDAPLDLLVVFLGMWLLGLGFALTGSMIIELVPEAERVLGFVMTPLYFVSGVIFPISAVPAQYREWVMLNPLAHGVEAARTAHGSHYHAAPETSIAYLYWFALVFVFLGLALHRRLARRLVTK